MAGEEDVSQPIEGFRDEPKIDMRTREGRAMRAGLRGDAERQDTRPDSVREAELRAQEIMESLEGSGALGGELDIPANLAPPGWVYELKAESIAGMENRHHMLGRYRTGWRPVPSSRHPHLMPKGHDGPIVIKGLMLMEIPEILWERRQQDDKREALDQLRNAESRLSEAPPNTAPRDHPKLENVARHEIYRPIQADERRKSDDRG